MDKYLLIKINSDRFIIDISNVIKITDVDKISPVSIKNIMGLVSIDDDLVPVVDIREKLGMDIIKSSKNNWCVIVVSINDKNIGILVDDVLDIIEFDRIKSNKSIKSVIDNNGDVLTFLNIDGILF